MSNRLATQDNARDSFYNWYMQRIAQALIGVTDNRTHAESVRLRRVRMKKGTYFDSRTQAEVEETRDMRNHKQPRRRGNFVYSKCTDGAFRFGTPQDAVHIYTREPKA